MKHHVVALALAASSTACAAQPIERPFVPALRYASDPAQHAPSEDAPFRAAPAAPALAAAPRQLSIESFTLDNGVLVVIVERHAFRMIAVRVVIDAAPALTADVGGRRALLLGQLYLAPAEGGRDTMAACGPVGCSIASRGAAGELRQVLGRLAELVTRAGGTPDVYARRLKTAEDGIAGSRRDPPAAFRRNARALAFGNHHRYGDSSDGDRPTLGDIQALRDRSFVPGATTIIVVGDVTAADVKAVATEQLGSWQASPSSGRPDPPPATVSPLRIVAFPDASRQILGGVVARGPAPGADDAPAFQVLVELLGGSPSGAAFRRARDEMGLSYTVGADLDWYREASMMTLGGSFERDGAIDALRALLAAIAQVRDAGASPGAIDSAKRTATARWRRSMSTDEGLSALLAAAVLQGRPLESVQDHPSRIATVTAAQVQAAARRYMSTSGLRVVLVGDPEFLVNANLIGFGTPTRTDGFGLPVP